MGKFSVNKLSACNLIHLQRVQQNFTAFMTSPGLVGNTHFDHWSKSRLYVFRNKFWTVSSAKTSAWGVYVNYGDKSKIFHCSWSDLSVNAPAKMKSVLWNYCLAKRWVSTPFPASQRYVERCAGHDPGRQHRHRLHVLSEDVISEQSFRLYATTLPCAR